MKIVIESPKGRVVIDGDVELALSRLRSWMMQAEATAERCLSATVSLHLDGEGCDHETQR